MTTDATPNATRPGRPARGKKYPAGLAIMLTTEQRAELDELVSSTGKSLGEVTRSLLADGLALNAALDRDQELRVDVERMAREGGVELDAAIATMLRFAVREADRRVKRNGQIAVDLAESLAKSGVPFDGLDVGSLHVEL